MTTAVVQRAHDMAEAERLSTAVVEAALAWREAHERRQRLEIDSTLEADVHLAIAADALRERTA